MIWAVVNRKLVLFSIQTEFSASNSVGDPAADCTEIRMAGFVSYSVCIGKLKFV